MSGGELSLIEALRRRLPPPGERVLAGIGDDASVVRGRPVCLTSVDSLIEGVHFELGQGRFSHSDVGFKAVSTALSDLAAMGAEPGEAYLMLGVPSHAAESDMLSIADGAIEVAEAFGVSIAGGDTTSSPVLSVCVTVIGWLESVAMPIYRSGAAPGDIVGVTGSLGGSGAGLAVMQGKAGGVGGGATGGGGARAGGASGGGGATASGGAIAAALSRALRPMPRVSEGRALAASGARAMIDVSDGIATDAAHVGRASGLTLEIDLSLLPLGEGVEEVSSALGVPPWQLAASSGEDYELCVCAAPAEKAKIERALSAAGGVGITWVGEAVPGTPGARFTIDGKMVELAGFEHRWQENGSASVSGPADHPASGLA